MRRWPRLAGASGAAQPGCRTRSAAARIQAGEGAAWTDNRYPPGEPEARYASWVADIAGQGSSSGLGSRPELDRADESQARTGASASENLD